MSYVLLPNPGQSLGQTRAQIQTNFATLQTAWAVNHVALGAAGQGKHKFLQMPVQGTIPAGLASGDSNQYAKTANGASQMFISPDNSGNEYQMTRCIAASFARFGTNTAYGSPPATFTQEGGWTFLPGGMLLQYGRFGKAGALGASGTIQFPVAFTNNPYSITAILIRSSSASQSMSLPTTGTTTQFTFQSTSSSSDGVYWFAIGV